MKVVFFIGCLPIMNLKTCAVFDGSVLLTGKIEKVPRGMQGEKSSKDIASSRDVVSTVSYSVTKK